MNKHKIFSIIITNCNLTNRNFEWNPNKIGMNKHNLVTYRQYDNIAESPLYLTIIKTFWRS